MSTYIIAEIGQNHNGQIELARRLIDMAAMPIIDPFGSHELQGVNAVKFTKRDLDYELSPSSASQPYAGNHSFGSTYGDHRRALELDEEAHSELYAYAKARRLDFVETLCAPSCVKMLNRFRPDALKVASRDLTNHPLLEALAETGLHLILSTGMSGPAELEKALEVITRVHEDVSILHCLSEYPAEYANLNLRTITYLQDQYPRYRIGYSDHSIGIVVPAVAVALGAAVIEKHITLSRAMKGSDHLGALEPEGLWRMTRDIRNIERSLGRVEMFRADSSETARRKLERSLAAKRALPRGHVIEATDLILLSPGVGFRWSERDLVIGRRLCQPVPAHEIITAEVLEYRP